MAKRKTSSGSAKLLKLVPSYDPFKTAKKGMYYDEEDGQRPVDFAADYCVHVKGRKARNHEPILFEPWQKSIWMNTFGWKTADGLRRYREVFIYLPRKNSKSTMASIMANFVFFCDGEPGAEIYTVANDKKQALVCWDISRQMIELNEELDDACQIFTSSKYITMDGLNSKYMALSKDLKNKWGDNPHMAIFDEVHANKDPDLFHAVSSGMGSRDQPLIIWITTADYERESLCNEMLEYAKNVRDGLIDDPGFLPVIYEADKDEDYTDIKVWRKTNPNLGVSVSLDFLKRQCKKAQNSAVFRNIFRRFYLNMRTEATERWVPMAFWDKCTGIPFTQAKYKTLSGFEKAKRKYVAEVTEGLAGKRCYGGIDVATRNDLMALTLYFPDDGHKLLCWYWVPRNGAERRALEHGVNYLGWAEDDYITLTPGEVTDFATVEAKILELNQIYNIAELAIDPWNGEYLMQRLGAEGIDMVPFRQGFPSMTGPAKELERLWLQYEMQHLGNPVLRWCMSNTVVSLDAAGNIKPDKDKSSEKIDGAVATIMAVGRGMVRKEPEVVLYNTSPIRKVFDE